MRPATKLGILSLLGLGVSLSPVAASSPELLGAGTCSTSGCHGGAGDMSDQYVVWAQRDVHSRSYATLGTARSARMAEALSIANPAASPRCIVCHAPLASVPAVGTGLGADPAEGVTCVSCHDVPSGWLRGHTRKDWTHADRVAAGMRDLNDLYCRANTCVACHQNVDPELVKVGRHPALIFELDGQTQDEPKHWREHLAEIGGQAWYVGQAVALREVSWALLNGRADAARSLPEWQGLVWLLARSGVGTGPAPLAPSAPSPSQLASMVESADMLAKRAAQAWEAQSAGAVLKRLAATQDDFLSQDSPQLVQACRAERLVLALDRLLAALPAESRPPGASASLDLLFKLAQSQPDFVAADFARELAAFSGTLGGVSGPAAR